MDAQTVMRYTWYKPGRRATLKAVADVPICPVCWDADPDGRPGTSVGDLLLAAGQSMAGADGT